ncbi:unannotated protein [freshwater metagenome]|uniref:Unannotated protein n=1 Tax=freshwater metagenome TaxID=449393 RepID=A0A6J7GZ53_9ZZZZ
MEVWPPARQRQGSTRHLRVITRGKSALLGRLLGPIHTPVLAPGVQTVLEAATGR